MCVECLRWVLKRCSGIVGQLKSNVDSRCRRCLEESSVGTVLQREVEIEPNRTERLTVSVVSSGICHRNKVNSTA